MRLIRPYPLSTVRIWAGRLMSANYRSTTQTMEVTAWHKNKLTVLLRWILMSSATLFRKSLDQRAEKHSPEVSQRHNHGTTNTKLLMIFLTRCCQSHMISGTLTDLISPILSETRVDVVLAIRCPSPKSSNHVSNFVMAPKSQCSRHNTWWPAATWMKAVMVDGPFSMDI